MKPKSKFKKESYKYDLLYQLQKEGGYDRNYGHTNHGANAINSIFINHLPLIDVGCGWNEFVQCLHKKFKYNYGEAYAIGVDCSCPRADIKMDITDRENGLKRFKDKEFKTLTCFDTLEHIREDDLDFVFKEFQRISETFIFSISYVDSIYKIDNETLHPTVKKKSWWLNKIRDFAIDLHEDFSGYIHGRWDQFLSNNK